MTEGSVIFEPAVSLEALATLGEGHIAYVKQIARKTCRDFSRRRRRSRRA
jgi:hypothetical protein